MTKAVNNKKTFSGTQRKCYLNGCGKIIPKNENISYLAVVHPPFGSYSFYPFDVDEGGVESINGAISCKLHGVVSQDLSFIFHANAMYRRKKCLKV